MPPPNISIDLMITIHNTQPKFLHISKTISHFEMNYKDKISIKFLDITFPSFFFFFFLEYEQKFYEHKASERDNMRSSNKPNTKPQGAFLVVVTCNNMLFQHFHPLRILLAANCTSLFYKRGNSNPPK